VARVVGETLDIMKKLKLIKEFRKKIDILEKEVQR
jgi:chaperonin cofactor prefoldin